MPLSPEAALEAEEKLTYWKHHTGAWKKTNTSMIAYCRAQQVNVDQFRYWHAKLYSDNLRKHHTRPAKMGFTEIKPMPLTVAKQQSHSPQSTSIEIILTTGISLKIPPDFNSEALAKLLRVLNAC